jgi:hypothetical protein
VLELQGPYDAAAAAGRHQDAADLEPDLMAARQELLIAEATTAALREAQAVLEREQAERRADDDARREREHAQVLIAEAMEAERQGLDAIAEQVGLMWSCLAAAQGAFRDAQELEREVGRSRYRLAQARVMAGEIEAIPGRLQGPNSASVLADEHQIIRELAGWRR